MLVKVGRDSSTFSVAKLQSTTQVGMHVFFLSLPSKYERGSRCLASKTGRGGGMGGEGARRVED